MYHQNSPYAAYQPIPPPSMRAPSHPPPPPLSIPGHPQHQYKQYNIGVSPAPQPQNLSQQIMPPSPSENGDRAGPEEDYFNLPGPPPVSHIWGGYIWAIEVVQQPQRARMCGFGDKDRRPISPPPCVRLIIIDAVTKKEIDYNDVDLTHLVLTVDIWDLSATREMNLVKQSNASPCISSAATGAYPITAGPSPTVHDPPRAYDVTTHPGYRTNHNPSPSGPGAGQNGYPSMAQGYHGQPFMYTNGQNGHPAPYQNGSPYPRPSYPDARFAGPQAPPAQLPPLSSVTSGEHTYVHQPPANTQLYTRNLIGSLCSSAFRLKDENDVWGIWFVLQDLSVRTEGWFRLKMSFFNISQAVQKQIAEATSGNPPSNSPEEEDTAPCLASTFSSPFRVYSAKKFPGVVESTPLSKAFANQGIKIPIRKDTGGKRGREESDEEASHAED